MFHDAILQPKHVNCQQLFSVFTTCNIPVMEGDEKQLFSERMNLVADILGIPPKGKNRQKLLGKVFHVSQESARKWLSGEGFPKTEQSIEIVKRANVSYEWFMTGRGAMFTESSFQDSAPEFHVLKVMRRMDDRTKIKLITITETLAGDEKQEPPKKFGDERRQRENSAEVENRKIPHLYKKELK
jgi:hypothetical protein